jgi:hypothetical protein
MPTRVTKLQIVLQMPRGKVSGIGLASKLAQNGLDWLVSALARTIVVPFAKITLFGKKYLAVWTYLGC